MTLTTFIMIVYALAALASVVTGALAWLAKIRWAAEYKEAKDAQIQAKDSEIRSLQESKQAQLQAKDAQLESLREITSTRLLSEFRAMKEMYEASFVEREKQIQALESKQISQGELVKRLRASNEEMQREIQDAEQHLSRQIETINISALRLRGTGTVGSTDAAVGADRSKLGENLKLLTSLLTQFASRDDELDPNDPGAVTDVMNYLREQGISADRSEVKEVLSKLKESLIKRFE